TNLNLHLGHSIFLPISLGSRIGTSASQLGHSCLKLVEVGMVGSPARPCADRHERRGRMIAIVPSYRPAGGRCQQEMPRESKNSLRRRRLYNSGGGCAVHVSRNVTRARPGVEGGE